MTTLTDTQVITASGGLVELGYGTRTTGFTSTTTASYQDIGISVPVVNDGSPVLVELIGSLAYLNTGTNGSECSFQFYRDGTGQGVACTTAFTLNNQGGENLYISQRLSGWTGAGTITVSVVPTSSVAVVLGAGAGGAGTRIPITLRVSKIVQATQWPAVTTGTIICTSSTRPASPFEGQTIYETDTDRTYLWSGSAWVSENVTDKPPMCVLTKSTQTITNAADAAISGYTVTADTDSMYSAGAPTRITFNTTGVYVVTANALWGSTASTRTDLYVKVNGGSTTRWRDIRYGTSERNHLAFTQAFTSGDYIEGYVYQSNSGASSIAVSPFDLAASWVGKGS